MNINYNFYDIYGYALPGFLLLTVLWLPFGLIDAQWPDAQFSSALAGIILAYIAGHILQTIAQIAIPSNFMNGRCPSSVFMDENDPVFSTNFKQRIAGQIKSAFGLNVSGDATDAMRTDAFFLCRSDLLKNKNAVYSEQFEGLYALMRGLSAAFGIGIAYYLGLASSGLLKFVKTLGFVPAGWWSWSWSGIVLVAGLLIALVLLIRGSEKRSKWLVIAPLLLAAFAAGYYLGLSRVALPNHRGQFIGAAVFCAFAAERCYAGYQIFSREFAKAVYRDFSTCQPEATVTENADPYSGMDD